MTVLKRKKEGPTCSFFTRARFGSKVMILGFRKVLREGLWASPAYRFWILKFRSATIGELRLEVALRGAEGEGSRFEPLLTCPEHREIVSLLYERETFALKPPRHENVNSVKSY